MDYLGLCQSLRSESGLGGGGPASVANQTGMLGRMVGWTQTSYANIQQEENWRFRWRRATATLQAGVAAYTGAALSLTDLGPVFVDGVRNAATLSKLAWMEWSRFDLLPAATGDPTRFARRPDGALVFHPTPTSATVLRIDYLRNTHVLVNNTDVPIWTDEAQQRAIVFGALIMYADHNADPDAMRRGIRGYEIAHSLMARDYLDPIVAAPLPMSAVDTGRPLLI
jgi:hypothetical protein